MPTIEPTFEEFKKLAAEFGRAAPTADRDALEAGYKCIGLAYIGLQFSEHPVFSQTERVAAPIVLNICSRTKLAREFELDRAGL